MTQLLNLRVSVHGVTPDTVFVLAGDWLAWKPAICMMYVFGCVCNQTQALFPHIYAADMLLHLIDLLRVLHLLSQLACVCNLRSSTLGRTPWMEPR
jgi:hypothetical protein